MEARSLLEAELEALGWVRVPGKGSWEPTQRFTVLGMCVDLALGCVCAVPEKATEVAAACSALNARWLLARLLARSLLPAVAAALPPGAPELWA